MLLCQPVRMNRKQTREDKFLEAKPSFPVKSRLKWDWFSSLLFQMIMLRGGWDPLLFILFPSGSFITLLLKPSIILNIIFKAIAIKKHVFYLTICLQTMIPRRQSCLMVKSGRIMENQIDQRLLWWNKNVCGLESSLCTLLVVILFLYYYYYSVISNNSNSELWLSSQTAICLWRDMSLQFVR